MANSRLINRTRPLRTVITPKTTQINFNMIGGHSTLYIHSKNGTVVGTLVWCGGKVELKPTDTSTPKSIEICIIEQAYKKLLTNDRRNNDDRNGPSSKRSASPPPDTSRLNVKGADNLKSVDLNWVNDLRIIEIINNDKIKLL